MGSMHGNDYRGGYRRDGWTVKVRGSQLAPIVRAKLAHWVKVEAEKRAEASRLMGDPTVSLTDESTWIGDLKTAAVTAASEAEKCRAWWTMVTGNEMQEFDLNHADYLYFDMDQSPPPGVQGTQVVPPEPPKPSGTV